MNKGDNRIPRRVLVTGVNGFVGSHIALAFLRAGYSVTGLLRKTSNTRLIKDLSIDLKYGDVTDRDSLTDAISGQDYIIHPAGLIQAKSIDAFMKVNQQGTKNVLEAAYENCQGLKKLVYISSQAAAGPSESEVPIDETIDPHPVSDYGRSKLAAESECHSFFDKLPVAIVRPPAVYGPGDEGILPFFKIVKSGWYWKFGLKERFASIVHVTDLARAVVLAAESENSNGETFFAANPGLNSICQMQKLMADIMKVEVKPLVTPIWLTKCLAGLDAVSSIVTGQPRSLTMDKIRELSQMYWLCNSSKAESVLGWKPEISQADGLTETIDWYIQHRWL